MQPSCNLCNQVVTYASKLLISFCAVLQNLAHNIESQNFHNLCLFYIRQPEGNYMLAFWDEVVKLGFIYAIKDMEFATYTIIK